jgi:D-glycero-D-manno-heptose 1,7-bisphosphate phosphatase
MALYFVMLDKDGTIVNSSHESGFVTKADDQVLIWGVEETLKGLNLCDHDFAIISNQAGIEAGHKSLEDTVEEMVWVLQKLPIKYAYFCPDFQGQKCYRVDKDHNLVEYNKQDWMTEGSSFRKPGTWMLELAIHEKEESLLKREILFIGDRPEDEQAAKSLGIEFMWAWEILS